MSEHKLPGTFAYKYTSDEPGDTCWDALLGLVREGVPVYHVPDLDIDVGRTFQRTELGGLTLQVNLVDAKRVAYLYETPPREPTGIAATIALAEATPADTVKRRLIEFLEWPAHRGGLLYEWNEVVEQLLLDDGMRLDASGTTTYRPEPPSVPMVLACPTCHVWHIDKDEWATRPHKTHLCLSCGAEFRPANVPTVGVVALPEITT